MNHRKEKSGSNAPESFEESGAHHGKSFSTLITDRGSDQSKDEKRENASGPQEGWLRPVWLPHQRSVPRWCPTGVPFIVLLIFRLSNFLMLFNFLQIFHFQFFKNSS